MALLACFAMTYDCQTSLGVGICSDWVLHEAWVGGSLSLVGIIPCIERKSRPSAHG